MATLDLDFTACALNPRDRGIPILGGWLDRVKFNVVATGVVVGESIQIKGEVPADEFWQVLQIRVRDKTKVGSIPNGWKWQSVSIQTPVDGSPSGSAAGGPRYTGQFTLESDPELVPVWYRAWDGATYLTWGEETTDDDPPLLIRPSDPVFAFHQWPRGLQYTVTSLIAEANAAAGSTYKVELIVLRFPHGELGRDGGKITKLDLDRFMRDLWRAQLLRK